MFKSLCSSLCGCVNHFSLPYTDYLFAWLDSENQPHFTSPLNCRGIMCCCAYADRKNIRFADNHSNESFVFDFSKLNLCVLVKKTKNDEFYERVDYLENKSIKFGITEPIIVNEIGQQDDFVIFQLTSSNKWISCAPMISYFLGILKYGNYRENNDYSNSEVIYFEDNFGMATSNLGEIKEEFSKNYDFSYYVGYTHDYGFCEWAKKHKRNKVKDDLEKISKK